MKKSDDADIISSMLWNEKLFQGRVLDSRYSLKNVLDSFHSVSFDSWDSKRFDLSDKEREIVKRCDSEISYIKKIAYSIPSNKKSEDLDDFRENQLRFYKAMKVWEEITSPVIVEDGKIFIIRCPRYMNEPYEVTTIPVRKFCDKVVPHVAALNHMLFERQKKYERVQLGFIITCILSVILSIIVFG